jgi:hypothetical protein
LAIARQFGKMKIGKVEVGMNISGAETTSPMESGWSLVSEDEKIILWEVRGDMSSQQWSDFLQAVTVRLHKGPRRFFVYDTTQLTNFRPECRKIVAEVRGKLKQAYAHGALGAIYLVKSKLVRGALQATFWLQKPTADYLVCGTREEAFKWISNRS